MRRSGLRFRDVGGFEGGVGFESGGRRVYLGQLETWRDGRIHKSRAPCALCPLSLLSLSP